MMNKIVGNLDPERKRLMQNSIIEMASNLLLNLKLILFEK